MEKIKALKEQVIEQNIKVHAREAPVYELLHPQVFNWYHNRKSRKDLRYIYNLVKSNSLVETLDIGCGTGFLTHKIITFNNFRVTAVDLSDAMLKELEDKVNPSCKDKLSLVHSEALAFLRDNSREYDLITTSALLHHLVDIDEFFGLALKRLKPGGILYVAYEPLKQAVTSKVRFMIHGWIRALDAAMFNLGLKFRKVSLSESHERSLADYQTMLGGIDPLKIISDLQSKGEVLRFDKFAVRANGFLAFISDKLVRSENTFSFIFKKS